MGSTWLEGCGEENQGGDERHQNDEGKGFARRGWDERAEEFVGVESRGWGGHDGTCLGVELGKHGLFPHLEDGLVFVGVQEFVEVSGVPLGRCAAVAPLHEYGGVVVIQVGDDVDYLLGHDGTCLGKAGLAAGKRQRMLTCKQMRGD